MSKKTVDKRKIFVKVMATILALLMIGSVTATLMYYIIAA